MTLKHFDDLTAIDCPLGELDADTIGRLVRASMDRRALDLSCGSKVWARLASAPAWDANMCYRLAPKPLTKPSVDWTDLTEQFICIAQTKEGCGVAFSRVPKIPDYHNYWHSKGDEVDLYSYASFAPGTCDRKDSLVMRPGYEGE